MLVKYVGNVDPSAGTAEITGLESGDRLVVGGVGEVTQEEYNRLVSQVSLDDPSEDEAQEYNDAKASAAASDPAPVEDLSALDNKALRSLAKDEEIDLQGARSNDDIVTRIQEAREETAQLQAEAAGNPGNLPATATTGPTGPAPGGGATGAGPEGAGASGDAGGGPSTAPATGGGTP